MEDHIVQAIVAVDDRNALLRRHGFRQPLGEFFEFGNVLRLGGAVLLGPAIDLAREIIAGLAEIAETDGLRIVSVQFRQRLDLPRAALPTIIPRLAPQPRTP